MTFSLTSSGSLWALPTSFTGHQDQPLSGRPRQSHRTLSSEGPAHGVVGSAIADWPPEILLNSIFVFLSFFFFFFFFSGPHPQHVEVSRQGVKWELQLPTYTSAIAMRDPSHVCDPHHSSQQCRIFDPMSEARDQTCVLMDTGQFVSTEPQQELPSWYFLVCVL